MQNNAIMFYKLAAQRTKNAYFLLVSFDSNISQRTAMQYVTLCNINENMLNNAVQQLASQHKASSVRDVSSDGVCKALNKLFAKQAAQYN